MMGNDPTSCDNTIVIVALNPNYIFIFQDGLPDWTWTIDNFEFNGTSVPSCIDPTYCLNKAPPINGTNVIYEEPPLGTLKFQDGKSIVYSCINPGIRSKKTYFVY